jgi:citrate lyase subunit beta/citryl-CoA lyase
MLVTLSCIAPLFVPGNRPDRYAKAATSGTDAIIIDLEDAVAPELKTAARAALAAPGALPLGAPVIVRLNGRNTPWHVEDLACVASLPVTGAMLAKAESGKDVAEVSKALGARPLIALIETACGLAAAREIARAGQGVRLAFGSIDFSADIGCAHTRDALLAARSELVLASALCGLPAPIDGVTTVLDDETAVEADARHAAELGFGGKLCIHPRQVAAVRRGFAPSEGERDWARRILVAEEQGAVALDGALVDAPIRARARRILARTPAS